MNPNYKDNEYIKMAAENFGAERSEENLYRLFDVLLKRMLDNGEAPAAMVDVNNAMPAIDLENLDEGDTFKLDREVRLRLDKVGRGDGVEWIPLYTDEEELSKQPTTNLTMNVSIESILYNGLSENVAGIVINPFGIALTVPKEILNIVIRRYEEISGGEEP